MEIILLKDLDKVGYKHDIVEVKNGYGRNFLIPQGVGVIANATNRKKLDGLKEEEAKKEAARIDEYKEMAANLEGKSIKIGVKAGTSGKIFGSVNNIQIAQALKEQLSMEVHRKKIDMEEWPKEIGTFTANVNFHDDVKGTIDFELIQE
jgi:large subunit ribosomal protein L9